MRRAWSCLLLGCTATPGSGDGEPACAELVSYFDRAELYHVATLSDRYVLDDRTELVGFDLDDAERFRIPIAFAFARARDDELVTVSATDGAVSVSAWTHDGDLAGELGRLADDQPLQLEGAAILSDGSAVVHGGETGAWWVGRVPVDGEGSIARSTDAQRRAVAPALGTDAYVLTSTWHDDLLTLEHLQLARIDAHDQPRWVVTVFDRREPASPLETHQLLASAGDDAYVVTYVMDATAPTYIRRRYGPDGTLRWTHEEPAQPLARPGLPIVREDGSLVWVDEDGEDLRIRFFDDAGAVRCEQRVIGDGLTLNDIDRIGDELFVLTIDRLTRIRVSDPPP